MHTTRSQWIVGLVLDFGMYERYLKFTNQTLDLAIKTTQKGKVYFDGLYLSTSYRKREYARTNSTMARDEELQLKQYFDILSGQLSELLVLHELHQKNWQDFLEIKRIGHSELEVARMRGRDRRAIGLLMGITGIFSGFSLFQTHKLRSEVQELRQNQETIRTVLKESLSLINLTKMEVKENRIAINKVINGLGELVSAFTGVVEPMRRFVITRGEIQTNIGKVRDLVSAESDLISELQQKVAKLATGKLSPTILPAPELVQILKGVEVEIPPELMLPQDPRERPFYYYTVLTTNTIALDNELVIAIEIPLLDVARKLKVMEAIALPVPYASTKLTAVYDLEFKNFAISADGRQYVILTLEDQLKCGNRETNYCSLTSAIQEANHHSYCTLALYQRDQAKVDKLCKVKVSSGLKLPIAHYVANGEWLIATEKPFNLRRCVGIGEENIVQVIPPYAAVTLESGCTVVSDLVELPIYFQRKSEYQVFQESRIASPPKNLKMSDLSIWKPVANKNLDVKLNIEKLGEIQDKPMEDLIADIERLQKEGSYEFPDNILLYVFICVVIISVAGMISILYCKRKVLLRVITRKLNQKTQHQEINLPMAQYGGTQTFTIPPSLGTDTDNGITDNTTNDNSASPGPKTTFRLVKVTD